MLSIRVSDTLYSIPCHQISYIGYVDTITALPFSVASIEGLINFNDQPLFQVNVHDALGFQNPSTPGKQLILTGAYSHYALRVDEVLNIDNAKSSVTATNQPVLPLNEILPWSFKTKKSRLTLKKNPIHSQQQTLTVLLAATGNKTIALLTHNIANIQEVTDLQALDGQSTTGDHLIKIKNQLSPSYSLGHLLKLTEVGAETIAIMVRGEQTNWALRVQRVLGLETIHQVYSSGLDARSLWYVAQTGQTRELINANDLVDKPDASAPRLWYVDSKGYIQELIDANHLLDKGHTPLAITITTPQQSTSASYPTKQFTNQGLRIYCGLASYFLPLSIATRTLKCDDLPTMAPVRHSHLGQTSIPWLDTTAFLFGKRSIAIENTVLITLANGAKILLGVDRFELMRTVSATEKWLVVDFPNPMTFFFDAAYYDEHIGQWILRVTHNITFATLPWNIKKLLAKAILGWLDCSLIRQSMYFPNKDYL